MMNALDHGPADAMGRKRRLVADLCRILGDQLREPTGGGNGHAAGNGHGRASEPPPEPVVSLSPRVRQTLERLLAGDSEKEIATRLGLSRHTVHVYVKTLYRRFEVCSRGELLARFVTRA
jgi:DNA-binding NarL/FixJ family response regulator